MRTFIVRLACIDAGRRGGRRATGAVQRGWRDHGSLAPGVARRRRQQEDLRRDGRHSGHARHRRRCPVPGRRVNLKYGTGSLADRFNRAEKQGDKNMVGSSHIQCTHYGVDFRRVARGIRANQPNRLRPRVRRRPASKASWGSFPGNLTRRVEVPHRVAASFVLMQDFGDQLHSRAVGAFVFLVFIRAIDPEAAEFCPCGISLLNFQRSADSASTKIRISAMVERTKQVRNAPVA